MLVALLSASTGSFAPQAVFAAENNQHESQDNNHDNHGDNHDGHGNEGHDNDGHGNNHDNHDGDDTHGGHDNDGHGHDGHDNHGGDDNHDGHDGNDGDNENDPVDACPSDEGFQAEGPCTSDDVCPNDEGIQTSTEQCTPEVTPEITPAVDLCPEEGIQSELPCATVTPPTETPNTNTDSNTGNGGGNGGGGNGPIAGSIPPGGIGGQGAGNGGGGNGGGNDNGTVKGASCAPLINSFMKMGKENDPAQVKLLQSFLNKELGLTLEVNGIFDAPTLDAVKAFQLKYSKEILGPWGISKATGYVYKTTARWINMLSCTGVEIPMPELQ